MKEQRKQKHAEGILSSTLARRTEETLREGKQAIMFQNRRGFAPVVVCHQCGWTPKCTNCDVSLVYHKNTGMLRCHYCGYAIPLPKLCPACGQNDIRIFGYGTERIAEEMHARFEGYRVARMDLDTTRNKDSYQEIIEEFARHETDILVGTQMVTKGLDFENVETVGVLNADTLLNFPDFRSNERAFNMLEQVAGRAGRRGDKGEVIIQTTQTENPVLGFVKNHDYIGFYEQEIGEREKYAYPPFTKVINIYLKNRDPRAVYEITDERIRQPCSRPRSTLREPCGLLSSAKHHAESGERSEHEESEGYPSPNLCLPCRTTLYQKLYSLFRCGSGVNRKQS